MASWPLYTVNTFTNKPFAGNPVAVCLVTDEKELNNDTKQQIATEFNTSQTVFLTRINNEDTFSTGNYFTLHWFSPNSGPLLRGVASLAAAAVLYKCLNNNNENIKFETDVGTLSAWSQNERLVISLPLNVLESKEQENVDDLLKVVVSDLPFTEVLYSVTTNNLLVRLNDALTRQNLEELSPLTKLMLHAYRSSEIQGIIVTLKGSCSNGCTNTGGDVYDFISRYFAPWKGIVEDPVTAWAHADLASYWSKELGKNELYAFQCSKRGGELWMAVKDDNMVNISGEAVIVIEGSLNISIME